MSKISKLLKNPVAFLRDSSLVCRLVGASAPAKGGFSAVFRVHDKEEPAEPRPMALMFGFTEWKRPYVRPYLEHYSVAFAPVKTKFPDVRHIVQAVPDKRIVVWGDKASEALVRFCQETQQPLWRMEDGFIRSAEIGAKHTPPMSLVIDKSGLYFDPRSPSDLEKILGGFAFGEHPDLLERARRCMELMRRRGVSKYNHAAAVSDIEKIYGPKRRRRVLVIGQVEEDASIKAGAGAVCTNDALVRLACVENPDSEIIYKPHPDVLAGCRRMLSDPSQMGAKIKVVDHPLSTPDALRTIDHVYTITSLVGMEALIRGIPVTCAGAPFYAGWGLTDDRYPDPFAGRRGRALTVEELFAGAYLLYPEYRDPDTGAKMTAEQVIAVLALVRGGVTPAVRSALLAAGLAEDQLIDLVGEEARLPAPAGDDAMRQILSATREAPDLPELRLLAVKHLLLRGEWTEAIRYLPDLQSALEGAVTAEHLAGLILVYVGAKRRLLVAALDRALRSAPQYYGNFAVAFRALGAPEEARAFYAGSVSANPQNRAALGALVELCLELNDQKSATSYALALCKLKVKKPALLLTASEALLADRRAPEALAAAEQAIILDPGCARAYDLAVRALRMQRREEEADAVAAAAEEACAVERRHRASA